MPFFGFILDFLFWLVVFLLEMQYSSESSTKEENQYHTFRLLNTDWVSY